MDVSGQTVGQLSGPGRSLRLGLVVVSAEFKIHYVTSALVPSAPAPSVR